MRLLFLDAKHLRDGPRSMSHALRGIMQDEIVAIPSHRRRVKLDRVVIVTRGPVQNIDFMGRRCSSADRWMIR